MGGFTIGRRSRLGIGIAVLTLSACAPAPPVSPAASPAPPTPGASTSASPAIAIGPSSGPDSSAAPTGSGEPTDGTEPHIDFGSTVFTPDFHDVAAVGGALIAVGGDSRGGVIWRSENGKDWTVVTDDAILDSVSLRAIATGGPQTVAVGCELRDGACVRGAAFAEHGGWKRSPSTVLRTADLRDVAMSATRVVAIGGSGGRPAVWTSTDGLVWSRVPSLPATRRADLRAIVHGPSGFVIVGVDRNRPAAWTSADGLAWRTGAIESATGPTGELNALAVTASGFIAGGGLDSRDEEGNPQRLPNIWTSRDGFRWEAGTGEFPCCTIRKIAVGAAGTLIVSEDIEGTYSKDGANWIQAVFDRPGVEQVIARSDGFLAVGQRAMWTNPKSALFPPLDPAANAPDAYGWQAQPLMPLLRPGFTAAADAGRIYVFSDLDGRGALRVDRYDIGARRWSRRPNVAAGILAPRAVTGSDHRIYLVGISSNGRSGRTVAYDASRGTWRVLAPIPTPRQDAAVALGPDGAIYVFGGRVVPCCDGVQGDGGLAVSERFDPRTGRWSRRAPMPRPAPAPSAAAARGSIFVFLPGRVWHYDPKRDRWTPGPANLSFGMDRAATAGADGLIRVFGCTRYDLFDAATNHWQPGRQLGVARCDPVVVAGNDAQVYVMGGVYTGSPGRLLESVDSGGG
jgi:hypothetical protein